MIKKKEANAFSLFKLVRRIDTLLVIVEKQFFAGFDRFCGDDVIEPAVFSACARCKHHVASLCVVIDVERYVHRVQIDNRVCDGIFVAVVDEKRVHQSNHRLGDASRAHLFVGQVDLRIGASPIRSKRVHRASDIAHRKNTDSLNS